MRNRARQGAKTGARKPLSPEPALAEAASKTLEAKEVQGQVFPERGWEGANSAAAQRGRGTGWRVRSPPQRPETRAHRPIRVGLRAPPLGRARGAGGSSAANRRGERGGGGGGGGARGAVRGASEGAGHAQQERPARQPIGVRGGNQARPASCARAGPRAPGLAPLPNGHSS